MLKFVLHISNQIDLLTLRLSPGVCLQLSSETTQCIQHMYIAFNPLLAALLLLPILTALMFITWRTSK